MFIVGKAPQARGLRTSDFASVILAVDNCRARLPSGCGPATAEAVIRFHRGISPSQEAIATAAGWHPNRGTRVDGLVKALQRFLACPPRRVDVHDAAVLSAQLARNCPAIVFVGTADDVGHAVVLSGMVVDGAATFAVVCDPMLANAFSLFVPFAKLSSTATGALAIPCESRG